MSFTDCLYRVRIEDLTLDTMGDAIAWCCENIGKHGWNHTGLTRHLDIFHYHTSFYFSDKVHATAFRMIFG